MRSFVKSIEDSDYKDIQNEVQMLLVTRDYMDKVGAPYEIGHQHRYWEYASAIKALSFSKIDVENILDVGAGLSILGPTLVDKYNKDVIECDPDPRCIESRKPFVDDKKVSQRYRTFTKGITELPLLYFDAVFCISVIEHLPVAIEENAWINLADRVKIGGVLFITVDCVREANRSYHFDNLRQTNFRVDILKHRIDSLIDKGFIPIGEIDLTYHGDFVFDYTFFQIGMIKKD